MTRQAIIFKTDKAHVIIYTHDGFAAVLVDRGPGKGLVPLGPHFVEKHQRLINEIMQSTNAVIKKDGKEVSRGSELDALRG
jgi:hypothetical protein